MFSIFCFMMSSIFATESDGVARGFVRAPGGDVGDSQMKNPAMPRRSAGVT